MHSQIFPGQFKYGLKNMLTEIDYLPLSYNNNEQILNTF